MAIAGLNAYSRRAETGVLASLGYTRRQVLQLFVARSALLALAGAVAGTFAASLLAQQLIPNVLVKTGAKFAVDPKVMLTVVSITICLATLAASLPACWAISRQPADIICEKS